MLRLISLFVLILSLITVNSLPAPSPNAASFCVAAECSLPDCRCASLDIPGNLDSSETPQIVLLTFDDAVNVLNYEIYKSLLFDRYNPDGCPIKVNFFLSHEYNNYTLVHDLYVRGYEMASHSITHRTNQNFWLQPEVSHWEKEMVDMRTMISTFANIPISEIKGTRAPFLLMGGNEMFTAYSNNAFEWDCTWATRNFIDPGMWPYTLKYRSIQDCPIGNCPNDTFPSMWVVPLVDHLDVNYNPCAMLDTCDAGSTRQNVYDFLMRNYNSHVNGNRSPFGLFLHAAWLQSNPEYLAGYKLFLDEISSHPQTYIVSISQLLEWVKNPAKLGSELDNFAPWSCNSPPTKNCVERRCYYGPDFTPFGSERYMSICNKQCPPFYPWYENIMGLNPPTPWAP